MIKEFLSVQRIEAPGDYRVSEDPISNPDFLIRHYPSMTVVRPFNERGGLEYFSRYFHPIYFRDKQGQLVRVNKLENGRYFGIITPGEFGSIHLRRWIGDSGRVIIQDLGPYELSKTTGEGQKVTFGPTDRDGSFTLHINNFRKEGGVDHWEARVIVKGVCQGALVRASVDWFNQIQDQYKLPLWRAVNQQ